FGQSIWRKVQTLKLSENYKKDEKTKSIVRRCLNLSFVKTDKIETEFQQLKEKYKKFIRKNEQIKQFITYFQQTYIGETDNSGVYVLPLFKKELWSVYNRTINSIPRTTNSVEAWHKSLNSRINHAHPNIAMFINVIQKEEEVLRLFLSRAKSGKVDFSKINLKKEEKLRIIVNNYNNYERKGFFKALNSIYKWKLN
ncbi:hypothetical protein CDIK_1097, partial [Cucumispora dikerogammari]